MKGKVYEMDERHAHWRACCLHALICCAIVYPGGGYNGCCGRSVVAVLFTQMMSCFACALTCSEECTHGNCLRMKAMRPD